MGAKKTISRKKPLAKPVKSVKKAAPKRQVYVESQEIVPISQAPALGELPELPDFSALSQSDLSMPPSQEQYAVPQPTSNSGKPKLWWLSWLLPGKQQPVVDAKVTDVAPESAQELVPLPSPADEIQTSEEQVPVPISIPSKKQSKKVDVKDVKPDVDLSREYEHVEDLKKRLDQDMRDRELALKGNQTKVKEREEELEKWHADLLARETQIVKNEKEFDKIKKLQQQLEDKEINQKHNEEETENLKNQLAEKELELTQKEAQLKDMSLKLEKTLKAQKVPVVTTNVEDDYGKLSKKQVNAKIEPRASFTKTVTSVESPSKREIRALMLKAYDQLSANNMSQLQVTYTQIRDSYAKMMAKSGQDEQLYKDILDLYSDIKLAVVQRS